MTHEKIVKNLTGDMRKLSNKLKGRKRFLDKIFDLVPSLVSKEGVVLSYSEHSCHTHVVSELNNFGHFSFHINLGQTMFGGDTVTIYYHPNRKFREGGIDFAHDKDWQPVLKVRSLIDYQVENFDEQRNWQRALLYVLKNKDRIVARIKKEQEKAKITVAQSRAVDESKNKLREEAKKLGII